MLEFYVLVLIQRLFYLAMLKSTHSGSQTCDSSLCSISPTNLVDYCTVFDFLSYANTTISFVIEHSCFTYPYHLWFVSLLEKLVRSIHFFLAFINSNIFVIDLATLQFLNNTFWTEWRIGKESLLVYSIFIFPRWFLDFPSLPLIVFLKLV